MMKKWLWSVLLLLLTGWIFWNSSQSAVASTRLSDGVMEIFGFSFSAFWIRKAAHLMQFALWGFLFSGTLRAWGVKGGGVTGYLLFGCMLCGAVDETIQLFPTGRSSELRDLWIDFCGGCLGVGIFSLLTKYRCKFKAHRL